MEKPSIIFFGTPDFAVPVVDALYAAKYPILGVVTTPDAPVGRKGIITPTPVKKWAIDHTIRVFTPQTLRDNTLIDELKTLSPFLFVVFSYGKIIPDEILTIPKIAPLNVHPSILPKYRGPSPVQAQILAGEPEVGVSIIKMNAQVDAGALLTQAVLPMPSDATFASLVQVLSEKGTQILIEGIERLMHGTASFTEQDHSQATFTEKISKESGFIADLTAIDPKRFDAMVRAYYPWPGVWTKLDNKVMKFLPGGLIQLEGKHPVSWKQMVNGYPALKPSLDRLYHD